jgi:hypothetical protein
VQTTSDAFSAQTVDLVALSPDGQTARLYIVQANPWTGSDSQVASLQEKIHNYVGFALDGQMVATYPETRDLPWEIVVVCQTGQPDERSGQVLAFTQEALKKHGGTLTVS